MFSEIMFATCKNEKDDRFTKSIPILRTWLKECFKKKGDKEKDKGDQRKSRERVIGIQ